ncbi:MAG: FtsX-like permease family protein, partial [bacterium]|nr:FtsX-like permease family protein [bacterium]
MNNKKQIPPQTGDWILRRILDPENYKEKTGDFEELFSELYTESGIVKAYLWFWLQVIFTIMIISVKNTIRSIEMFKNYLKIAFRNIKRHKAYSFINISGLAVGIVCCVFIILWIQNQLSYDRFNENLDYLYRVYIEYPSGNSSVLSSHSSPVVSGWLKEDFPEIKNAARFALDINTKQILVKHDSKQFYEEEFGFGDAELFELFTFPFITGDPKTALSDPNSIVISEEFANKYFGDEDPIGKIIEVESQYEFIVTGVFRNIPENSHFHFDSLVPFENIVTFMPEYGNFINNQGMHKFRNYVMVDKNVSIPELKEKVYLCWGNRNDDPESKWHFLLQPVKEIHLYNSGIRDLENHGNIRNVYIFSISGLLILIIACINYINLTTARSFTRAKEVGIRKVVGANRINLVGQFYGESVLISVFSLILAAIIIFVLKSPFYALSGTQISLNMFYNKFVFAGFLIIVFIVGLVSGSYPALFLSSFRPVKVLKGVFGSEKGNGLARRVLVVWQFVVAISLIICSAVIYTQFKYMQNKDLGFDKENIISINLNDGLKKRPDLIKNELMENPEIDNVTFSAKNINNGYTTTAWYHWGERHKGFWAKHSIVGSDFFDTFNVEVVKGRNFSELGSVQPLKELIINETAEKMMKVESPLGLTSYWGGDQIDGKIVGVIKDFHFQSLHTSVSPLLIAVDPVQYEIMHIKINPGNVSSTINYIERICDEVEPGMLFEWRFLDESLNTLYA